MLIQKILNNNVVITEDDQNNEIIVMGRGLAFNKKIGEEIPTEKIDKTYRLADEDAQLKFQELLADLPPEYLEMTEEIIQKAHEVIGKQLNEMIYISLADHLHTAIERSKKGIHVRNLLLWDIKRFFPAEFQVGRLAIMKIQDQYQVQLPEDEAGFIALHLVNAQMDNDEMNDMYDLTNTMQDIMNIVKYYFKVDFDEESVYFYRFTTHLRFFVSRLLSKSQHTDETDQELLDIVKVKYCNAYQCVNRIADFLLEKHQYQISNDERLYLTIHIARLVQKNS